MLSAAEYFEHSAKPAQRPAAAHQPQAFRPFDGRAATRQEVAPKRAASSGPSGNTHVPEVMPKTGTRFSSTAAHSPAGAPNSAPATRYINQVVSANSAIKGIRTAIALSLPARCAAPQ